MKVAHLFGRVYGWTLEDVYKLTPGEVNYLGMLIDMDNKRNG